MTEHGYKFSTIKRMLSSKISAWLATLPDTIRGKVAQDTLVCGGAITSLMLGEMPNDYDIYFRTKETAKLVAQHYCSLVPTNIGTPQIHETQIKDFNGEPEERIQIYIKSSGIVDIDGDISVDEEALEGIKVSDKREGYTTRYITSNAITLTNKVQLVIRFWGNPTEIYKNYDFVHCQASFDFSANSLDVSKETMQSVLSKTLIYNGSKYPVASLLRLRKFLSRGWRISAGQALKIGIQLRRWDTTDMVQLREQLIGVDMTYMLRFVEAIRDHEGQVDDKYLAELIDKIFADM